MMYRIPILLVVSSIINFLAYWGAFVYGNQDDSLKIDYSQAEIFDALSNQTMGDDCETKGGMSYEKGLKVWCWGDIEIPVYKGKSYSNLYQNQLSIASECSEGQVSIEGHRLKFDLNPMQPKAGEWCSNSYNMRAEISTSPWLVKHPIGTEEWFGWRYTLGENYIIDRANPWLFFQIHEGTSGEVPLISLWSVNQGGPGTGIAGEIHLVNSAGENASKYYPTGLIPKAGQSFDVVVHVVWGDDKSGLLQVWIDDRLVHDKKLRTVRASNPVGGNAKWGIYKWPWRNLTGVHSSQKQGIENLVTYMGSLRMITRDPNDPSYLENSYNEVNPR
ncbi:heparin lyase I family protein [Pseudozobellia sp. WGM2]|uniref:heparin lyase I family protein n=1 Tax=Pseudozobellia sp. WGM2 TaxID=2787625 RepID=UPI001ADF2EC9|nr:heparin lyase I family protein [Pseudozobellia sp. WGM2]